MNKRRAVQGLRNPRGGASLQQAARVPQEAQSNSPPRQTAHSAQSRGVSTDPSRQAVGKDVTVNQTVSSVQAHRSGSTQGHRTIHANEDGDTPTGETGCLPVQKFQTPPGGSMQQRPSSPSGGGKRSRVQGPQPTQDDTFLQQTVRADKKRVSPMAPVAQPSRGDTSEGSIPKAPGEQGPCSKSTQQQENRQGGGGEMLPAQFTPSIQSTLNQQQPTDSAGGREHSTIQNIPLSVLLQNLPQRGTRFGNTMVGPTGRERLWVPPYFDPHLREDSVTPTQNNSLLPDRVRSRHIKSQSYNFYIRTEFMIAAKFQASCAETGEDFVESIAVNHNMEVPQEYPRMVVIQNSVWPCDPAASNVWQLGVPDGDRTRPPRRKSIAKLTSTDLTECVRET